jgi:hypothetical protein
VFDAWISLVAFEWSEKFFMPRHFWEACKFLAFFELWDNRGMELDVWIRRWLKNLFVVLWDELEI